MNDFAVKLTYFAKFQLNIGVRSVTFVWELLLTVQKYATFHRSKKAESFHLIENVRYEVVFMGQLHAGLAEATSSGARRFPTSRLRDTDEFPRYDSRFRGEENMRAE